MPEMRLVVATDGSDTARAAVRYVAAAPFTPATQVLLVAVLEDALSPVEIEALPGQQHDALEEATAHAREELGALLETEATLLRDAGYQVTTEIRTGQAAAEIVRAGDTHDAELLVVGSHGQGGFRQFLLGSVSDQVLRFATRSVLVVRDRDADDAAATVPPAATGHPWRVLLAYDGSDASDRAVELCTSLDLDATAAVQLLTVLPMMRTFRQDVLQQLDPIWQRKKASEQAALEAAGDRLRAGQAAVTTALVEADDVSQSILSAAETFGADLIVLGHKGHGAVEGWLTGSITLRIAHHADRSVLAAR